MIRAVITDIEGTTSSIDFVHAVLFPYSARALPDFLRRAMRDGAPEVMHWVKHVADEIGVAPSRLDAVTKALLEWIRIDRKHTALKALQGMVWRHGYEEGAFRAHVYPDVAPVLSAWHAAGVKLYVYSSGSIAAQKLFFAHSEAGDLSPLFSDYFDTTTGPKRAADSYRKILASIGEPESEVLFLSDIPAELDAAREAGIGTYWLVRNPEPAVNLAADSVRNQGSEHPMVQRFDQINLDSH